MHTHLHKPHTWPKKKKIGFILKEKGSVNLAKSYKVIMTGRTLGHRGMQCGASGWEGVAEGDGGRG